MDEAAVYDPRQSIDLAPGDYWLTSLGDGRGPAIVTREGRLLVEQFDTTWSDLTDAYLRGASDSWVIKPRAGDES